MRAAEPRASFRNHFGSSCLGSNPRGQVVAVVGTGHHALVVFWQVFKTPRFGGFLELTAPGSGLHALVVF